MALPPIDVVPLFAPERRAMIDLLAELREDQWTLPTACAGWSVHDVALHLFGDDIGRLSRGCDGVANPSFGDPDLDLSTWSGLVAAIDRQNDLWVRATRRISPRLLGDLLRFTGDATAAYFAQVDGSALGSPVNWAGPDPAPIWFDLAREYTERWVHQQHIRDAVRRPGMTEPRWMAPVLQTFAMALPHALRDVAVPSGTGVGLIITGDAGGVWWAVRTADRWDLSETPPVVQATTVQIDQASAWRRFTRGTSPDASEALVEGDQAIGQQVLQMVTIIA